MEPSNSSEDGTWTFGEFVESLAVHDEWLAHLARFLTGRYPPNSKVLTWSKSTAVNVVVCDIYTNPPRCMFFDVHDLSSLQSYCMPTRVDTGVKLRLFLVEDMTAPVVETLGAAFQCYPEVFAEHMCSTVERWPVDIDVHGRPMTGHEGSFESEFVWCGSLPSDHQQDHHFSIPFFRQREYESIKDQKAHERQRTMPRTYMEHIEFLEERISGSIYEVPGFSCPIAILLFDSIGGTSTLLSQPRGMRSNVCEYAERFTPMKGQPRHSVSPTNESTREMIIEQLRKSKYLAAVVEDNSYLLCAIIKNAMLEHRNIAEFFSFYTGADDDDVDLVEDDTRIATLMTFPPACLDLLRYMEPIHAIVESGGPESCRCQPGTKSAKLMANLRSDLRFLTKQVEKIADGIRSRLQILAAIRSIRESEKAIKQSHTIGSLTSLATFYIPLSFAASLLGMNVTAISSTTTPLWVYFVIAIPLTAISLLIIGKWEVAMLVWHFLFKKGIRNRRQRWKQFLRHPRSAISTGEMKV